MRHDSRARSAGVDGTVTIPNPDKADKYKHIDADKTNLVRLDGLLDTGEQPHENPRVARHHVAQCWSQDRMP